MSSILTNTSAMVALQTLRSTNENLGMVQSHIATGKKVASASDNSAIWSISKVMEFDVTGFEAINDGLGIASSTISVAMEAGEQIVNVLNEIKSLAISANSEGADFTKIDKEIQTRVTQVTAIAEGAQFNGINLLASDDIDGNGNSSLTVLTALNRAGSGSVPTAATVSVDSVDILNNVDMSDVDVSSGDVADAASSLDALESHLQTVVSGLATLGASKAQVDMQRDFLSKSVDAMKSGISTLVDADMEEASARLQALQTQQQLGIQSLSIANQQPQALLQLFR